MTTTQPKLSFPVSIRYITTEGGNVLSKCLLNIEGSNDVSWTYVSLKKKKNQIHNCFMFIIHIDSLALGYSNSITNALGLFQYC